SLTIQDYINSILNGKGITLQKVNYLAFEEDRPTISQTAKIPQQDHGMSGATAPMNAARSPMGASTSPMSAAPAPQQPNVPISFKEPAQDRPHLKGTSSSRWHMPGAPPAGADTAPMPKADQRAPSFLSSNPKPADQGRGMGHDPAVVHSPTDVSGKKGQTFAANVALLRSELAKALLSPDFHENFAHSRSFQERFVLLRELDFELLLSDEKIREIAQKVPPE